ncbi:MAG: M20 family metallo-hydrolase [Spirochaetaceae bacterium]|nr:M20 family metallo-hydrolase [Spirochaetaceae bacterium]
MEQEIFDFIDGCEDFAVELQTGLTRRPAISPLSGGEGELDKCVFLEQWLVEHGIDALERHDAPDPRAKGGVRPNLIATISGEDSSALPRLWIMSHLDVVPVGELSLWDSDPWTVVKNNGRLIGRGVEDNQQGLVSSVLAALALVKLKLQPPRTLKLLFAADEECGSTFGINWLLKNRRNLFKNDDLVLIPDGGDPLGETIEIAEKNQMWLKVHTTGKQAHASRPDHGRNAYLAGADLTLRLRNGLMKKFSARDCLFEPDYTTVEPTKKEANVPNVNTIPGDDVFYIDIRALPCYSVDGILEEARRIKTGVEQEYGVQVELTVTQSMESKPTPSSSPIVTMLSAACKRTLGVETRLTGVGGGTVGAFLRNEGIASVVWSRIQSTAHQPNEYCLVENMLSDAKVMACMAVMR